MSARATLAHTAALTTGSCSIGSTTPGRRMLADVTSSGRVSSAGPGRPDIARTAAFRTIAGADPDSRTSAENFVMCRAIATMLRWLELPSCKAPLPKRRFGTSPASTRTGSESQCADARPVMQFKAPGPEVTITTPSRPVARAYAAAANIAPPSWRLVITLMFG